MRVAGPEKMDNGQILNKEKIKITVSKKKKTKGSAFVAIATNVEPLLFVFFIINGHYEFFFI